MGSRKKIWCLVVFLLCCLLWSGELFAITTAPYYPIKEGNSWTYNNSDTGTYTTTVLNGTVPVNGVATFVLQDSDGSQSYITNDQNGIRLHREYVPSVWIDGLGYASLDGIYSPPIKMVDAETTVGASIFSTGSAITTISGLGTFSLTYSLISSIDGIESVTVPAGTYQAVKVTQTLTLSGNIQGTYASETSTNTVWLAKDIGQVKYLWSSPDGIVEEVLISTNIVPQVAPVVYSDYNADGTSDILFQHSDDGRLLIWTMNNFMRTLRFPANISWLWDVKGKGDFNGDGTSDVFYVNDIGETAIAEMKNANRLSLKFPGGINPIWSVQGVGDFNGDGTDDILWRRSTDHIIMIWGMSNSGRAKITFPGGLANFWDVVGVGDFNNNGTDDILYQHNSDGRLLIWEMNDYIRASLKFANSIASTWKVVGVGDFNDDGTDDVLYRKDDGSTAIAEFANLNRSALKFPGGVRPIWSVQDVGDYNGDGTDDILFRRSTDNVTMIWGINNSVRTNIKFPGGLAAQWVVQ